MAETKVRKPNERCWVDKRVYCKGAWCKRCNRLAYQSLPTVCEVCGVRLEQHPQCGYCRIGIGTGHLETIQIDGLCLTCWGEGRQVIKVAKEDES